MTTREDELREKARAFHRKYPEVWDLFVRFASEKIALGYKHYSADAIMHRVRWETDRGRDAPPGFKINDHHVTFYAEGFMAKFPEHDGFFRRRRRNSEDRPPNDRGVLDD